MNYSKVKKTEYHIHRFMYDLGIKNSALLVYAALYSFTVGERGIFHGSQKYLAESLGISVRTLQNVLKSLFSLGLIENHVTEDEKYTGVRCVNLKILEERKKAEQQKALEVSKKFAEELAEKIKKRKAEASSEAAPAEAVVEGIREAVPKTALPEASEAALPEEKSEISEDGITEEMSEAKTDTRVESHLARIDELCARINKKIHSGSVSEIMLGKSLTEHEKNTFAMMEKYEKSGDNRKFLAFGKSGGVIMTEPQYKRLLDLLPTEELLPYFVKFEAMLKENIKTGKKAPHSHYKTIKKWIEEDMAL